MILLSHPTGNANVREAALALAEAGLLSEFWTTLNWNPAGRWQRWLPARLNELLARRAFPLAVRDKTHIQPFWETLRLTLPHLGLGALTGDQTGLFGIDAVCARLDRKVARRLPNVDRLTAVYGYEDCAIRMFSVAAARGLPRFYDLPIGYWKAGRAIYSEEQEREPEWACTLSGMLDDRAKLERKDEELRLASAIFVASTFTRQTLSSSPGAAKTIHVIPYGAPSVASVTSAPVAAPARRLKILFVGSLSQRKGLSYLLRAVEKMKGYVELTLVGRKVARNCRPLEDALRRHHWIRSLPHAEVLREMGRHDVLVFPSLFEGFGLVILEAMAQGLPVITTAHTAGPDIIEDGTDGFIVPIRSAEAIVAKLEILATDRSRLEAMSAAAIRTALRFTWENYRRRLVEALVPLDAKKS